MRIAGDAGMICFLSDAPFSVMPGLFIDVFMISGQT